MIKELRRVEIGDYLLVLWYDDGQSGVLGTFPEQWLVRTHLHYVPASSRPWNLKERTKVSVARKKTFVSGATAFNKTVARVRAQEENRLLSTPMIPEVSHV